MQRDRRNDEERHEGRGRRDDEDWRGMGRDDDWRHRGESRGEWRGMGRDRDEGRGMGRDRDREEWRGRDEWRGMGRDRDEGRGMGRDRDEWRGRGRGRDEDWRESTERDRDVWRGQMGGMGREWRRGIGGRGDYETRDWRDTEPYYGGGGYGGYGGGYGGGHRGYGGRFEQERGGFGRHRDERGERQGRGGYGEDDRSFMDRVGEGIRRVFGMEEDERERGPHYGKGPKGYRRSDERVREDVCDRLAQSDWVDASEVEVRVHEGEVTLSGTVQHRREKRIMEELIENLPGVKDVHNQIRVDRERRTGTRTEEGRAPTTHRSS